METERESETQVPLLLDLKAASAFTGLSTWTLRGLQWGGDLHGEKIGRKLFFTRAELLGFVARTFGDNGGDSEIRQHNSKRTNTLPSKNRRTG